MGISSNPAGIQNQLPISENWPSEPNELSERLYDVYQNIANAVNSKVGGLYYPEEKITSAQYFIPGNPQRLSNVYRKTIDFGPIALIGVNSQPHGITFPTGAYGTHVYATATRPSPFSIIPIPFASPTLLSNISLEIDDTFVIITTADDYSAYTICKVVIEYVKG